MPLTEEQLKEIETQRAATAPTRRAMSEGMEERLFTAHEVLDHGFVRVIDYMGNDSAIVQAARVSYGAGTKKVSDDEGLIRYLMRHWHSTPFEMCEIKLHVKLPIFVARQWIRHRTANVNEYSARYSTLDREFYIPAAERVGRQSEDNKQGTGAGYDAPTAERIRAEMVQSGARDFDLYDLLIEKGGDYDLAREQARAVLPASTYTQWYWKVDLHNLLHFLRLRADDHAQYEIRVYAEAICEIVADWVPMAYRAFEEYRLGGAHLSDMGLACARRLVAGEAVTQETSGMGGREWREFARAMGLPEE
ncbi:MAG: FAD-dependent thymidylate synthase [Pseudomonadota bacterium]